MFLIFCIFLTVSVGLVAGYHLLTGLIAPDAARARRRLAEEFDPSRPGPVQSPLFKNIDDLNLDPAVSPAEIALPTAPKGRDMRARLELLLRRADVPLTLAQLGAIAGGAG